MRIAVYQNGKMVGWVQTVSVYKGKFMITKDKSKAKHGYKTYEAIHGDIDLCHAMCKGAYAFMVDES